MRAWRDPHKVVHVLHDGRVYILDTGQKVHFERLKPHRSGPTEFVTAPLDSGEIVVILDPDSEQLAEAIDDDKSQPSYRTEKLLSDASDVSLPSHKRPWMETRLRTKLRAGGSRMHYQHFDYSPSGTDEDLTDAMLPGSTAQPLPTLDISLEKKLQVLEQDPPTDTSYAVVLPQLFSEHERARSPSPQLSVYRRERSPSLEGTSAPLLTNPTLTEILKDYPISTPHPQASDASLGRASSPSAYDDSYDMLPLPTTPSFKRGRGAAQERLSSSAQKKGQRKKVAGKPVTTKGSQSCYHLQTRRHPRYRCRTPLEPGETHRRTGRPKDGFTVLRKDVFRN